jgi:hypothetical protein
MLPQRRLSPHQNQANHGFCNQLQNIGAARLFLGYHQIWLRREDEEKMSFITPFGTYYYLRMSEGLYNAGPTFCRMRNAALKYQVGRNVLSYVNDIVVASK